MGEEFLVNRFMILEVEVLTDKSENFFFKYFL